VLVNKACLLHLSALGDSIIACGEVMNKFMHQIFRSDGKTTIAGVFCLLMGFSGITEAALSGYQPGYPRFFTEGVAFLDYDYNGSGVSMLSFNADKHVSWQTTNDSDSIVEVEAPLFKVMVNLDASDPLSPQVLGGSSIEVRGSISDADEADGLTNVSESAAAVSLLYSANIVDMFWSTGRSGTVEFIQDGASMQGEVCDLGYCSYANELLQISMRAFQGNWGRKFHKTATAIATVPIPSAFWLIGSALLGWVQLTRRKTI